MFAKARGGPEVVPWCYETFRLARALTPLHAMQQVRLHAY